MDGALNGVAMLSREQSVQIAQSCIDAAGLHSTVDVRFDERTDALAISGPDQFGMMGMTAYRTLRITAPVTRAAIALAVARHFFGEFFATDAEIIERAAELPLVLAAELLARD